ncbi:Helix-hairpin-helix motif protein [compost metagenome]
MHSKLGLFTLFWCLFAIPISLYAQQQEVNIVDTIIESVVAQHETEELDINDLANQLYYYKRHPLNLNTASNEELKSLYLLNDLQISAIKEHIQKFGALADVAELQVIDLIDKSTILQLKPFVSVMAVTGATSYKFSDLVHLSDNEFVVTAASILEDARGYKDHKYIGDKIRLYSRLSYSYTDKIKMTFQAHKDAGEAFFNTKLKGFDFYTGNLFIKDAGRLKQLVIGDYSLQFGQGVAMWTGYAMGKSAMTVNTARIGTGVGAFRSSNENAYLRGVAGKLAFNKNLSFTPFVSFRSLDATLHKSDSLSFVSALLTTGYHRTETELTNQKSLKELLYGGNLSAQLFRKLTIGLTGFHFQYDKPLIKTAHLYNQFEFTRKEQSALSFSYGLNLSRFYFYGEEAKLINGGTGTINGVLVAISPNSTLSFLYRNYQRSFSNPFSQAFGESGNNNNERGFYSGINIKLTPKIEWAGYADHFNFPWLKYRVDAPTNGYGLFSMICYVPNRKAKFELRFTKQEKDINQTQSESTITSVVTDTRKNYRFSFEYDISQGFSLGNKIDYVTFQESKNPLESGFAMSFNLALQNRTKRLGIESRYTLFDTDSYNSRLYAAEKDILYSYSSAMYQNAGTRFYVNLKAIPIKSLTFWLRYSVYSYRNVEQLGSGYDVIDGNKKSEVKAQMRYAF